MSLLAHIVTTKQEEVSAARARTSLTVLQQLCSELPPREPFSFTSLRRAHRFCIGEIKPRSPSRGLLIHESKIPTIVTFYTTSPVDMISVLTDTTYFGGSADLCALVRAQTPTPLLRKEFIIDEYQLYESRLLGVEALLLIAALLPEDTLAHYIQITKSLGMDALVECHTETDVERALNGRATTIGINNRNLDTLAIDLTTTERLRTHIPPHILCVTESGIESPEDIHRMKHAGVDGFLIGTSFLTAPERAHFLSTMLDTIHTP